MEYVSYCSTLTEKGSLTDINPDAGVLSGLCLDPQSID
jgi:hypothetical protein